MIAEAISSIAFVVSPEVVAICCEAAETVPAEDETSPIVAPSFARLAFWAAGPPGPAEHVVEGGAELAELVGRRDLDGRRDRLGVDHEVAVRRRLEYLEAAFYTEAPKVGALSGELALFAAVVGAHERAHVKAVKAVLGRRAVAKPKFDFRATTESADDFAATAQVLGDTGVAAYAGQAPKVTAEAIL